MNLYRYLLALFVCCSCNTGDSTKTDFSDNENLIDWSISACDADSDPYSLINNISAFSQEKNKTKIAINFADNCCINVSPDVHFKNNTLFVLPYLELSEALCECNCCYTLNLVIKDLPEKFAVSFAGENVEFSDDKYPVFPITYKIINGDTLNRTNKYGASIGHWIEYYDNGQLASDYIYEIQQHHYKSFAIFSQRFDSIGQILAYENADSTLKWFLNGQLAYIRYSETLPNQNEITYTRAYYSNGQLKEDKVSTYFAEENRVDGTISQSSVNVSYYENGQLEFLSGTDTSWTWFENGNLMKIATKDSLTEYYENGTIESTHSSWFIESTASLKLNQNLYFYYNEKGKIVEKLFISQEPKTSGFTTSRYVWKWDENGNLIKRPDSEPDIKTLKANRIQ